MNNTNLFGKTAILIMIVIFIVNLFLSDGSPLWIALSGGGAIVDYTAGSYETVFHNLQLYRLVTYGYTQTAVWHLLANVLSLWYVSLYLEKKTGTVRFMLVFHIGLVVAGGILLALYPAGLHYGASPAVFACLGLLANWLMKNKGMWEEYKSQKGFYYMLYYFIFSNSLGVPTLVFHALGFCTGFLLGFAVRENNR